MLGIKQRQLNLRTYMYFYKGSIDGVEGNGTKQAYKDFQRYVGLSADGIYGANTENKLKEKIRAIQAKVGVAQDGCVGDATINAIKNYQSRNGLKADGIVGQATWNKMFNQPAPSSKYQCKYFKDSEFTCKCGCGLNLQKNGIKRIADEIREHYGRPVTITSGTRCAKHNKAVGGVANSYHTKGNAMDIVVSGVSSNEVYNYVRSAFINTGRARYSYKINSNATHIDTGGKE